MSGSATTLAELLVELTNTAPTLPLYRFLNDGELESDLLTAAELHKSAMAIARRLREHCETGDRVLLLAAPGLEFIRGFFGIQYAGLIATTSYPPHPRRVERTLHRMQAIVAGCQPKVALATKPLLGFAEQLGLPSIEIDAEELPENEDLSHIQVDSSTPAFLQFTSGSTRDPRGVILTHRNVLENLRFIKERFGHTSESVGVIWLPPYHDMGLIGGILEPLYAGFPVVLLNPMHALQRPMRWLNAIARYRATTSGGPNFMFDHCANIVTDSQKSELNLSSWQVAFCGAEPVRPGTWRRFSDAFAVCGFRKSAFFPCYGLAEATLMVTGGEQLTSPDTCVVESKALSGKVISTEYISCGFADRNHSLRIIDQEINEPVADGSVGEIWVAGESVSPGYWNDEASTEATFCSAAIEGNFEVKRWLRTGDLGFVQNGSLFVTGRCKDLIIVAGRNLYPQDLEAAIEECHPRLQPNGSCVFSMPGESQERLIVVAEMRPGVRRLEAEEHAEISAAIRRTLSTEFDVHYKELRLVKAGALPRTSSGKKRRSETLSMFESKRFQHEEVVLGDAEVSTRSRGIHQASPTAKRLQQRLALVMVVVPILGLFTAIVLSWGEGVQTIDLAWLIGLYIATVIGVEVGFHRHFSHRSFQASPFVRSMLCILGSMAAQGPLVFWVATHRRHHAFSDQAEDPHSPVPARSGVLAKLHGLYHSHVGWLFRSELTNPMQYGPDILRDPLTFKLNQYYPLWVLLGLALPALGCFAVTGTWMGLARGFLWGGLVRILLVHHATWSVNSICHSYGKREYETRDDSRNNAWLVMSSLGGSWHNNHHAFPNSAYTGIRNWQIDPSGWVIRALAITGLVWDVKTPALNSSLQVESLPLDKKSITTEHSS